ncbi:MAG TPA: V-type ATP synthase subunit E family protein [Candidatus Nitrosotalea sp.]|nr:V-type ATP synthase subunit E family protein [Candidatus Nitrosotalea sp.]
MSIETFLLEIENRKKREIESHDKEYAEKRSKLQAELDITVREIQEKFANEAKVKSEREHARIIEAAKLQAKKIIFDAINANMQSAFEVIKREIESYTKGPQYKKALETMVASAKKKLGQNIVVHCRDEDKSVLKDMGVTIGKSVKTLGGIVAENKEGTKELDLTFEELLRTNEDQIKSFLSERM